MQTNDIIETSRLQLRRPADSDAQEIFDRYAADPDTTRYMGFRAHASLDDTYAFLRQSAAEWSRWGAGPYMLRLRANNSLIGSTGLHYETTLRAMTGYILAKDSWGKGYATEAVKAIIGLARERRVQRLYALCHTEHRPSMHVLEKSGFVREGILRAYMEFPNLSPGRASDVYCYAIVL